jgi:uncharacterized membrane protein YqjE
MTPPGDSSAEERVEPTPGILDDASTLAGELHGLVHDQLKLIGIETRLAALGFMKMTAAAAGIGMLLAASWLGILGVATLGLVRSGLTPAVALLTVTILNLAAAYAVWDLIRRNSRIFGLPTTLRSLGPRA